VELRFRNHTVLTRSAVIDAIADCVSKVHKVELTNPQVFILVEVFKVFFFHMTHY
jgi:tRNA acetyltransferase TAN1